MIAKRHSSREEQKENNAQTPDVCLFAVAIGEHFRSDVVGTATGLRWEKGKMLWALLHVEEVVGCKKECHYSHQ